jgi:[glutamine synthetase] adenylyltransferase / [glutamine synthetase]-adenylyl-L-tyrosine phosphorylase
VRVGLLKAGVTDSQAALDAVNEIESLTGQGIDGLILTNSLAGVADPDLALTSLARMFASASEQKLTRLMKTIAADPLVLGRLLNILGVSTGLADFLVRHPDIEVIADSEALAQPPQGIKDRLLLSVGADPREEIPIAESADEIVLDRLRVAYYAELMAIAVRDLTGIYPMEVIAGWLSDLADATINAGLAIGRVGVTEPRTPIAVIAMGKTGGRELNYISDVDVIFATDDSDSINDATQIARGLMRACGASTVEGSIWEVDAALRPEGKQGALVRTVESHIGYYERWASTWEFQALLKARYVAGDATVGEQYIHGVQPFIWAAADRDGFVDDVQAMRRRVEEHVDATVADREIKLGPGGLRDIEFSVQLLQLVHGRSDVLIRSSNTIDALRALAMWGYVGRDEASKLEQSYRFLRTLEHRIQLRHLRRTHTMPTNPEELRVIARSMGITSDPATTLLEQWGRNRTEVRRIHEKLFYRPLLNAVAGLDASQARLSSAAAADRLRALGFLDPSGAMRNIEALSSGVSRRANIQRTLLPVMLSWFAQAPFPDTGLSAFRAVSDQVGTSHWYLRLLRDDSLVAERLAILLASSKYVTDLVRKVPESISMLAHNEDLVVPVLGPEIDSVLKRHEDPERAVASLRAIRRRELFRISSADALRLTDVSTVGRSLTEVAEETIGGALSSVGTSAGVESRVRVAVVGMGRFGGNELGFGSDADLMFVYEPVTGADPEGAAKSAFAQVNQMRNLLSAPADEPPMEIDADLRPEGKNGPLVRSLESFAAYYDKWSSPWEAQALLRARTVAGDAELGTRFEQLIAPVRYPVGGLSANALLEMRKLKARMETERLPRGIDPNRHIKLGRGGLSDVEWTVQLLQLNHADEFPELQTTQTLQAIFAAEQVGVLTNRDSVILAEAWTLASEVRNAIVLVKGKSSDVLPIDITDLAAIAYLMGYSRSRVGQLEQDYLRATRRARGVTERVFYGRE